MTTPLSTLLEHAEAERDAAITVLRNAEAAAAHAQAQAEQLQTYRSQYQQRWSTQFRQAGSIELLQCYQGFGQRLDQAITQQSHTAAQAQNRVAQARAVLLEREQRVAAVRKLIERRGQEQRRVDDRREQRSTDEAASRCRDNGVSRLTLSLI
ncbi:flagellar export protein FliJ [Aquincola sp. S2]|uniref:Flagellar FliJ protein n=1 Tax=Pseudaquabacterium terrae TaxID=2732868 RepID=A0ABX2EIP8_9BURK|nr:flagellar export protein FliJ [Aquabacterium terrae]NRF68502.1 flagellar export protein FliJ [Aquabacterium terrae]